MAGLGLAATLVDISVEAIALAEQAAAEADVRLSTRRLDLETDPLPDGPWDLIVSFRYLRRELFDVFPKILSPGGLLVFAQPTRTNLKRHARPPARFLLEDGELPSLADGLDIVQYTEGWRDNDRHEARLVARRPA